MIEVPYLSLDIDTLQNLLEAFVLREGTDYGLHELSLEEKVQRLRSQLEKGKVKIFFDEKEESCTVINTDSISKNSLGMDSVDTNRCDSDDADTPSPSGFIPE